MDCRKVGKLIFDLRKEKGMTQNELADAMNISDRTISKWERGIGCPDVSLLYELSNILGINVEKILLGDLTLNMVNSGNIRKIRFYVCPICNNILFSTGETEMYCCGRKISPLLLQEATLGHETVVEDIENDRYIKFTHEMTKEHYLSFIAYVSFDRILLIKLYPEQTAEVRFTKMHGGQIYFYCNKHGLMKQANTLM